ncbi:WNK protein kinase [Reticulomyxa filosa]|uniref:WNK protein kinase n=1 Tax=Reticulomyxa filosa TaxID=46433 RepID=X6MLL2_RETFI|nr:WNK protein kinase [Reticulomyxa filosa]|eukprot:ETO13950.1 WNK protein kinase [Reticulomyxa filosa]
MGGSNQLQSTMSVVGTPHWMAPEMYKEKYNQAVDIWSFGMCILELVTGRIPYEECRSAPAVYQKVTQGKKPSILNQIPDKSLRGFIAICLEHDPRLRPSATELLEHPFLLPRTTDTNTIQCFVIYKYIVCIIICYYTILLFCWKQKKVSTKKPEMDTIDEEQMNEEKVNSGTMPTLSKGEKSKNRAKRNSGANLVVPPKPRKKGKVSFGVHLFFFVIKKKKKRSCLFHDELVRVTDIETRGANRKSRAAKNRARGTLYQDETSNLSTP